MMTSKSLLLFVVASTLALASARQSGQDAAVAWIRAHTQKGKDAPDMDELAELKTQNPTAYAMVKMLLTKNSLGLIKRKDDAGISVNEDGEPDGSDAMPQAPSGGRNFLNWKPADDTATVQNVLGAVASLTAVNKNQQKVDQGAADEIAAAASTKTEEPPPKTVSAVESATAAEENVASTRNRYADVATVNSDSVFAAGAAAVQHSSSSNQADDTSGKKAGGWGNIFGAFNKPQTQKAVKKSSASLATSSTENSYLKGFDWDMDMKGVSVNVPSARRPKMTQDNAYAGFLS